MISLAAAEVLREIISVRLPGFFLAPKTHCRDCHALKKRALLGLCVAHLFIVLVNAYDWRPARIGTGVPTHPA
jgi:hypothetical protein